MEIKYFEQSNISDFADLSGSHFESLSWYICTTKTFVFNEMKRLISKDDQIPKKGLMKTFSPVLCTRLECFTRKNYHNMIYTGMTVFCKFLEICV